VFSKYPCGCIKEGKTEVIQNNVLVAKISDLAISTRSNVINLYAYLPGNIRNVRLMELSGKKSVLRFEVADCHRETMMCQHFSGHKVKQILAAFRSSLAINSYWPNEVAHGCKTPRCIQIYPA
jgi:hypothetical protein